MTEKMFRRLALSLPEATEGTHMGHADFRVRGKIFATLGAPEKGWGMVKLTPEQQSTYLTMDAGVFVPVQGAWGRQGCTYVKLRTAQQDVVLGALITAWQNIAPHDLVLRRS